MRPGHRSSAFTLLEVLLALLVFSIAVVALVEVINTMGRAMIEARRNREITARLESLMLETTRKPRPQESPGGRGFESTTRVDGVEYHLKMAPVEMTNADGEPLPDLHTVRATARWKEGGQDQEMSAETLLYPSLYAPKTF